MFIVFVFEGRLLIDGYYLYFSGTIQLHCNFFAVFCSESFYVILYVLCSRSALNYKLPLFVLWLLMEWKGVVQHKRRDLKCFPCGLRVRLSAIVCSIDCHLFWTMADGSINQDGSGQENPLKTTNVWYEYSSIQNRLPYKICIHFDTSAFVIQTESVGSNEPSTSIIQHPCRRHFQHPMPDDCRKRKRRKERESVRLFNPNSGQIRARDTSNRCHRFKPKNPDTYCII